MLKFVVPLLLVSGETDQEFEELLALLKEATFDHAGNIPVFA